MARKDIKVEVQEVQADETVSDPTKTEVSGSGKIFTYVGAGDTPPHRIEFMGLQRFVRGQPTEVINPVVLRGIIGNPSFVEGEVDQDTLFNADEVESKKAEEQRKADKRLNDAFTKKHKSED